jgi:exosortase
MSIAVQSEQASARESSLRRNDPEDRMATGNGLLFALGYAPLLTLFFINLWGRPHYQFFPLALLGAAFLAWTGLKDVPRPFEPGKPRLTVLLLAASFFFLVAATLYWSPGLGSIAALIGLVGLVWRMGGQRLLKAMLPMLLLVLTVIPPPLSADARLIQHLRVLAVGCSSRLLDILGVTHALSGNVIELPGQKLLVDEACSGINSVLITLACCLFYGLWRRRSAIHILLCLTSALSFVLLGNLVRITLGAWLKFRYGIDSLSGAAHEVTGLLLFVSYLAMILSTDQLLVFLTSPIKPQERPAETPPPAAAGAVALKRAPVRIPRAWRRAAGCAFALLGVADLGLGWVHYQDSKAPTALPKSGLRQGATFAMPEQIGSWKRLNTEVPPLQKVETRGVFSQVWHYRRGDTLASLAIDYPFRGYHDVTYCYTVRGWELLQERFRSGQKTNASPPFVEVRMQNHLGLHGALWFSVVDERGRWLPGPGLNPSLKESIQERLKIGSLNDSVTYQLQVLSTGFNPLRPVEREQVQQFFEEARMMLWRQLFEQMQRKP